MNENRQTVIGSAKATVLQTWFEGDRAMPGTIALYDDFVSDSMRQWKLKFIQTFSAGNRTGYQDSFEQEPPSRSSDIQH